MTERTEVRLRCKADGGLVAVLTGTDRPDTLRWCNDPRAAQGRLKRSGEWPDLDEWLDAHPGTALTDQSWPPKGWNELPIELARGEATATWAYCHHRGCERLIELWHVMEVLEHAWRQGRSSVKA